ncbi:grasp-with-spasm system ATP-grasp peptide maturase [Pedobacter sp. KBW06]|uniref:grasp-with-spasm system ATP-grasp peptide maturase n=1 Tax=Pedobacter sp. KBW06 TaxID=2153359 RepID=UPI000F5B14FC|nr:grasp-with-spasm system ATP-grasp peptide maturase [Pedobacter sp. KBW06]RQO65155.1 grasp-with-spasm system ATP-grasp peptide maturase [Pedobacter sp. KBW06]
MIVINSISKDHTTTEVIRWLIALGVKDFVRIDSDVEDIEFVGYNGIDSFIISKNGIPINLFESKSYWYRRGGVISFSKSKLKEIKLSQDINLEKKLIGNISSENQALNDYIKQFVAHRSPVSLGSYHNSSLNKLHVLDLARQFGIKTPGTFVINTKKELSRKLVENGPLITKAISEGVSIYNVNHSYYSYTEEINESDLVNISDVFFPSLFQKKVDKKFEIRVFFLSDRFYSMVILSQRNKQTEVDFRKYDERKPNRFLPFRLPAEVELKLAALFKALDLNTGSADFVVDKNNEYFFLEINPVGQFSMVSYPCNYYLEKEVAKFLIN